MFSVKSFLAIATVAATSVVANHGLTLNNRCSLYGDTPAPYRSASNALILLAVLTSPCTRQLFTVPDFQVELDFWL